MPPWAKRLAADGTDAESGSDKPHEFFRIELFAMERLGTLQKKQILVRRGADEKPSRTQAVKYAVKESLRMRKMLNRFKRNNNVEGTLPTGRKLLSIPAHK